MEEREIKVMRLMEWERAKGSLEAILNTYFSDSPKDFRYEQMKKEIRYFIGKVEDAGLVD